MKLKAERVRISPLYVLLVLAGSSCVSGQDLTNKVHEYMQAQMKVNRFSGSILMAREGRILMRQAYGMANIELEVPNTPETKFRIGSVTKQFTAMLVMQLEESRKLSVQDSICKYLPDCPEAWKEVTLHHLLTHTSGIFSYTGAPGFNSIVRLATPPDKIVALFRDRPLEFKPGERYKYSNSGYLLLGMIVEKAAGKGYEALLAENIFKPLGMRDSGYDHAETILPHRASGYSSRRGPPLNSSFIDMSVPHAAGALYSTVDDLYLWDQALYTEKLLSKSSLDRMFTPNLQKYGYGWHIVSHLNRKNIWHTGHVNGFSAIISRYPDQRAAVIVLSNLEGPTSGNVGRNLAAIMFGEPYESPADRKEVTIDAKLLDQYAGRYEFELEHGRIITIERSGNHLAMQMGGQPKTEIIPQSSAKFFFKDMDIQISFVKDEGGRVTQLILHQGADDRRAKRIQ